MANRECNGDFFIAEAVSYYKCLLDGEVFVLPSTTTVCPNCKRVIDAEKHGVLAVTTQIVKSVNIPRFGVLNVYSKVDA